MVFINITLVVIVTMIVIFNESIQLEEDLLIFSPHSSNCPDILRNSVFSHTSIILAVLNSKLLYMCLSIHIALVNIVLLYISKIQ